MSNEELKSGIYGIDQILEIYYNTGILKGCLIFSTLELQWGNIYALYAHLLKHMHMLYLVVDLF